MSSTLNADLRVQHPQVAESARAENPLRIRISARFLLGIYLIVPLCLLVMICDRLLWDGKLFTLMPDSPESYFVFQLVFGTPHIIASAVILGINTNYVGTYWPRLFLFSLMLLVFFGVGSLFIPYNGFLAIVGAATVLHVIKQQVGIGKGLCRISSWVYETWGWVLVVFGSLLYFAVYAGDHFARQTMGWVDGTLLALAGIVLVLTIVCHTRITTTLGRLYLWANAVMVLQSGYFYLEGYAFLTILAPRLVHDITAFTFYITHDMNRHGKDSDNVLYRVPSKLGLGVFWITPALAVLLTYLIGRYVDPIANFIVQPIYGYHLPYAVSFIFVGYLGLLHYFTEAFTWKHGSPYRQYVGMRA